MILLEIISFTFANFSMLEEYFFENLRHFLGRGQNTYLKCKNEKKFFSKFEQILVLTAQFSKTNPLLNLYFS